MARLELGKLVGLGALAGLISGGLVAIMNSTILQLYSSNLADQWLGNLQENGAFDEDTYNSLLNSVQLYNNTAFPIAAGIGMGAMLSLVYHYVQRVHPMERLKAALVIVIVLWFVISVIPTLKYPPDAEATYDPAKEPNYYMLLAGYTFVSAAASVAAAKIFSKVRRKDRWLGAGALYLIIIAIASFAFPEIPHDETLFPLQVLIPWRATIAGETGAFWLVLGIISGLLFRFRLGQSKPLRVAGQ